MCCQEVRESGFECIHPHGFQEIQMFVIRCMIVSKILVLGWFLKKIPITVFTS